MNHGQKVKLVNSFRDDAPEMSGTIVGMGHVNLPTVFSVGTKMVPIYLVKLDEGFWSHENRIFHSIIPVHRENLELIESPSNNG
jgi:hypothetical protein